MLALAEGARPLEVPARWPCSPSGPSAACARRTRTFLIEPSAPPPRPAGDHPGVGRAQQEPMPRPATWVNALDRVPGQIGPTTPVPPCTRCSSPGPSTGRWCSSTSQPALPIPCSPWRDMLALPDDERLAPSLKRPPGSAGHLAHGGGEYNRDPDLGTTNPPPLWSAVWWQGGSTRSREAPGPLHRPRSPRRRARPRPTS